ncbi:hypothetical protein BP6252_07267 [Coleophoma cylindrospora]|uniref:Uncharacterized protein n=1 Tax=Coleophoma cylindrospora TaxID=1849047 RepID=A0A3D8RHB2_9HELO|nr:hypothetical protein BP6252_07267 [Coleophoma cylindrospora]
MSSSLSRPALGSLCRSCSTSISSRTFGTTAPLSRIGPESPRFIDIPQPPQQSAKAPRDIKGTLPPPRKIFSSRGVDKTDPEYFARTAPEPTSAHKLSEPQNDRIAWKRQMAETRRSHLREGLLELHRRKVAQQKSMAKESKKKRDIRDQKFYAPQREDERLTSPTIRALNSTLQKGHLPDPEREQRLVEKAARVQEHQAAKEAARKNALHTLYMHARNFITTEEQLNAKIDELFVDYPWQDSNAGRSTNIWDALGAPPTVQDMLTSINKTEKQAIKFHSGQAIVTGERMKKVAEELTGGKMD